MTNIDALTAELHPFTVDGIVIEKSLLDNGLTGMDTYSAILTGVIATCAVKILTDLLSLASESEGGFSQSYDKNGLEQKINSIVKNNGLNSGLFVGATVQNKSDMW